MSRVLAAFKNVFGANGGTAEAVFRGFDTDRNGLVDLHECFAVLILMAKMPYVARLRTLFELHDENSDDQLSQHEVEILMLSCVRGMCKVIGR